MNEELWNRIAVIGAGGKMGRGISLLLLLEMVRAETERQQDITLGKCRLCLIDSNYDSLYVMVRQLRPQIRAYAEKNIQKLRNYCLKNEKLISNTEIIEAFCDSCLRSIEIGSELSYAKGSKLIFEAIFEDPKIKVETLTYLMGICPDAYYFSNTSSIPVSFLAEKSGLMNKIVGLHFYNPPTAQKLIETIYPQNISQELRQITDEICQRLNKVIIPSADVAGFIGNGHMIREMVYANQQVTKLYPRYSKMEAIYFINYVTQHFLIRPMGIFQLMDFVGLDICLQIAQVMSTFLKEDLALPLCKELIDRGNKGGIDYDGSQKKGFFSYQKHEIVGVFDWDSGDYKPLTAPVIEQYNKILGSLPKNHIPWKKMQNDINKDAKLNQYFLALGEEDSEGAHLAIAFLERSAQIAEELVQHRVAQKIEDVDSLLEKGFHHLYPPRFALVTKVKAGN